MGTKTRFKIGQSVRVVQQGNDYCGKIGKVSYDDGDDEDCYPYTVTFSDGEEDTYNREHLESCEKTLQMLAEGDMVITPGGDERVVLGVCGKAIFIDSGNGYTDYAYSPAYMEKQGWKVKQEATEQIERTVEELEKELKLAPGTLRIKGEEAA